MATKDSKTELYLRSGILPKWHDKTLDDFTNDTEAKKVVTNYLKNHKQALSDGVGLFLHGANGTGKTLLMNTAFKELMELRYRVQIITMSGLITKFTSGWYDAEERRGLQRILQTVHFLGIEEVGKEFRSQNNDLSVTVFDHIVRTRVQMKLPTWFTSNKSPTDVTTVYTEDIASMLREVSVPVKVKGEDYRRRISDEIIEKYK